ncbi:hydroxymethylbilane synthase [Lachnospiraceae bacterium 62-35]
MKIRIGTRKSRLAVIQTEIVKKAIEQKARGQVEIEIVPVITQGDRVLDKSLMAFGGKGVFTKELEEQLLEGSIDIAVHSAKDMPMEFPKGLAIGAVLEREDPRDVLVTRTGIKAAELPPGSIVGTSSLRRELQIKSVNPQVQIQLLRGNVETRLEKLKNGEYDGILLAAAGLNRLGIREGEEFFFEYMDTERFVPAAGQGILAVEIRTGELEELMKAIHSEEAAEILEAERTFLTVLGGGCNAPCGAHCERLERGHGLKMNVMYARDGKNPVFDRMEIEQNEEIKGVREARWLAEKLAERVALGKVILAGAGPGDSGLISRKAWKAVKEADVIVYDNLISPSILNAARLDAELIYAGKRMGSHSMRQEDINRLLIEQAEQGKYVLRLKGGDPYIFGRGGEEGLALAERGIPFEVIPGISSAYSVLAYAGIPVTDRELASSFHVITGHERSDKSLPSMNYSVLAKEEGTLVFLMGRHGLKGIAEELMKYGKPADTPAAIVEKGTTAAQKTITGVLSDIAEKAEEGGIRTPAVIVIGEVAALRDRLSWFEKGPLFGKRILVTGTRQMVKQLEQVLLPLKAEVAAVSLIETEPLITGQTADCLCHLERYTWLVFTSSNGVIGFFKELKELEADLRSMLHVKFAVIGRGTERTLKDYGFSSDFIPSVYSSEQLAEEWVPSLYETDRVLFIRAEESSRAIPDKLEKAGIPWEEAAIYRTIPDWRREEELNRLGREMDYVILTSGSGARAFAAMAKKKEDFFGKIVSIGPVTSCEAKKAGLHVDITAAVYTAEGIADSILADVRKKKF